MSRFRTPLYTTEDLLIAMRAAAAASSGPLTQAAYVRWVATRPSRSEPSRGVIVKRLGSWRAALQLAGVPGTDNGRPAAGTAHGPAPPRLAASVTGRRQYADAEMLESMREAALATGRAGLSRSDYEAYRASCRRRAVASSQTIDHRFGGWQAALERAGLVPRTRADRTAVRGDAVHALRLFAATRPAARLSQGRYDSFRDAVGPWLPAAAEITNAHGRWRDAIAAAGIDADARHRQQLLGAMVATAAFTPDGAPTFAAYQERARRGARLPSYRTFYRAFDNWPAAVAAAGLRPVSGT